MLENSPGLKWNFLRNGVFLEGPAGGRGARTAAPASRRGTCCRDKRRRGEGGRAGRGRGGRGRRGEPVGPGRTVLTPAQPRALASGVPREGCVGRSPRKTVGSPPPRGRGGEGSALSPSRLSLARAPIPSCPLGPPPGPAARHCHRRTWQTKPRTATGLPTSRGRGGFSTCTVQNWGPPDWARLTRCSGRAVCKVGERRRLELSCPDTWQAGPHQGDGTGRWGSGGTKHPHSGVSARPGPLGTQPSPGLPVRAPASSAPGGLALSARPDTSQPCRRGPARGFLQECGPGLALLPVGREPWRGLAEGAPRQAPQCRAAGWELGPPLACGFRGRGEE